MRILAFAASNSRTSINRELVLHAAERLRGEYLPGAEIATIDLNDHEMPIYSIDREREGGVPDRARDFLDRIGEADVVLVSFAEHNGNFTAAFKNVLDWASRIEQRIWQGKPLVLLATSPGPGGARSVLTAAERSAPFWGGDLQGTLSVPRFKEVFDLDRGALADPELAAALDEVLADLAAAVEEQRHAA